MSIYDVKREGNGNFPPAIRCFLCAHPGPGPGSDSARLYPFLGKYCCESCAASIRDFFHKTLSTEGDPT